MTCPSTNVEACNDLSKASGITRSKGVYEFTPKVSHAGVITHTCVHDDGHEGMCECLCGHKFLRNYG